MAQDKLGINHKGFNLTHISIDNAASPFYWVLGIVGLFSYFTAVYWLFIACIVFVMLLLGYAFIFDDRKMRGEKYNLELHKIAKLGEKDDPEIIEGEEVVQPVIQTRRVQISAKASIKKI